MSKSRTLRIHGEKVCRKFVSHIPFTVCFTTFQKASPKKTLKAIGEDPPPHIHVSVEEVPWMFFGDVVGGSGCTQLHKQNQQVIWTTFQLLPSQLAVEKALRKLGGVKPILGIFWIETPSESVSYGKSKLPTLNTNYPWLGIFFQPKMSSIGESLVALQEHHCIVCWEGVQLLPMRWPETTHSITPVASPISWSGTTFWRVRRTW